MGQRAEFREMAISFPGGGSELPSRSSLGFAPIAALKIALVASETAPFAKTGGLADVVASLARALHRQGHEVRVFLPLYESLRSDGHDAIWNTTGDKQRVWGTPFAQLSASTDIANEHVLFAIQPVTKSRKEATAAVEMAAAAKKRLPGFAALTWDKAIRSHDIDRLWDLQLQPLIGVHDKTGRHTDHFPLGKHTINGLPVRLIAHKGAVCIPTLTGDLASLEPVKLAYRPNRRDGQRVYGTFRVPGGSDCDTRLWDGTVDQRLNSYRRSDVVYGEHVRALAPRSERWNRLYGLRSLSESMNSWLQARLGPSNRARSLGRKKQWLDLLALQLLRNDQTRMLYRERVRCENTAAPPRAA